MPPGLFGDLPQAKSGSDAEQPVSSWGATPKLQPQLRKPSTILAPPPSLLRAGAGRGQATPGRGGGRTGPGPVSVPGEPRSVTVKSEPHQDGGAQEAGNSSCAPVSNISTLASSIFSHVTDEYDPSKPNDYEEVLRERDRIKREAEAEAERAAKIKEVEAAMERARQRDAEGGGIGSYSAAAPPSSLNVSGDEAYMRRAAASTGPNILPGPPPLPGAGLGMGGAGLGAGTSAAGAAAAGAAGGAEAGKGMTLAQKLLMKMGWKEGEGLGRERQGISTPLVMQKTNARAGVVVAAEPLAGGPAEKKQRTGATIVGQPSKVLCLRNMVGPGEVDEELEEEVGLECANKYGAVTGVLIFEVTQPGYEAEEAVRIFVQFERPESAMKALIDLQGRFFAGRQVRAAFFPEERFTATDLAPKPGEFD